MTDAGAVEDLVDDRPGMAASLEAILEVDEAVDGWTFDDVPVDTGEFGTLVSRGVVEERSDGDGYRIADRDAVLSALGETPEADGDTGTSGGFALPGFGSGGTAVRERLSTASLRERDRDWIGVGAVASVVALFVVARAHIYGDVFRGGDVVLTVNDPYYYRTLVDQTLAVAPSPLDAAVLADLPASSGEPLYVATMWLIAASLGGGTDVTGAVLAWYPVVAAAITGVLVYLLGTRVLGDRRVGFVAAVTLALTPAYATRTGLGFADHHPFDYLWLTATVVAFARLVARESPAPTDGSGWRTAIRLDGAERRGATLLGVAVAGQTLSWSNSPVLLFPVGLYVAAKAPVDVSVGRSPVDANAPVVAALGVASVPVALVHLGLGWLPAAAALAPLGLLAGSAGVVAVAELLSRRGRGARLIAGVEVGVAALAVAFLVGVVPELAADLFDGLGRLFRAGAVSESESLFSPAHFGGLEWFGFFLLLAVPFMLWGLRRGLRGSGHWLVLSVYGWYLFVLSGVQLRFMSELAIVLSVFTGVGFVWCLARLGVWTPPAPFGRDDADPDPVGLPALAPRTLVIAAVCLLAVSSLSVAFLGPKVEITVRDGEGHGAAIWMRSYSDERGWEFPENRVFSRRDTNRMYNYFVSGNARSYSYAESNYPAFIYDDDPFAWYLRLRHEVGFVVIEPLPRRRGTIQSLLYNTYGSAFREHDAVEHYRAVYASESTTRKVFVLVPGARVVGIAPPNTTVELRTDVEIPNVAFTYRTEVTSGSWGIYTAVVPYPGEYEIRIGNRTRRTTIPERAVRNGTTVSVVP